MQRLYCCVPKPFKMTFKKPYLFLGLIGITVLAGVFLKQKYPRLKIGQIWPKQAAISPAIRDKIQNGDLIFQTSLSSQSKAIQLATHSKYSHCGLIFKENSEYYVFEAVQPVKKTPLSKWIARGQEGHYVIKRLKNSKQILDEPTLAKMKQVGQQFAGKNYDLAFDWSDDKIYCSELIWKMYKRAAGIEIGHLEKFSDFDWTNDLVKRKIQERYGSNIPKDGIVISPKAIFESPLLETVIEN